MRASALHAPCRSAAPQPAGDEETAPAHSALALAVILLLAAATPSLAADYEAAFAQFHSGEYETVLAVAEKETSNHFSDVRWWRLRLDCLLTLGRYAEGAEALQQAMRQHYVDGAVRTAGYEILRQNGEPQKAKELIDELLRVAAGSPWRFHAPTDRVGLGRAATLAGIDAREVLEQFFDQAKKIDPDLRAVYAAIGELALAKHDESVAAETFREALKKFPDDPDFLYGLARAIGKEADDESAKLLEQALTRNPRHLPSLFFTAESSLNHEDFADAQTALAKILAVNLHHPRAWALAAVLAHLRADPFGERLCRETALRGWAENPEVDHVIGSQLSRAYRFAEGAAHQRQALAFDATYLPARTQLAQDLLRLGERDEGWKLVGEVQQADEYNVVAYNLATLYERLKNYAVLESPYFRLFMDRREAAVYGPRVLALLERARQTLGDKYGWQPSQPVTVEILTSQGDFAIRTFGLPGGDGILGVCFGTVITANSPAALPGQTTNWEATLWHEFCHVVTLELTHHRLPRWLSEGISVYEERQANPAWGNRLDREMRQMILAGEMPKVSKLSDAFRRPRSPAHFNLAYLQSSLVVEYLVEKLGHATLRRILTDVANGLPINDSLALRTGSLHGLDQAFDTYARNKAAAYGPTVDWNDADDLPPLPKGPSVAVAEWLKDRPKHFRGRLRLGRALIEEKEWAEAQRVLTALTADVPEWAGDESPYMLLAQTHRELGDAAGERRVLETSAARSDDALETYRRLIELAAKADDAAALRTNVERYLAVQPLDAFPYHAAVEKLSAPADLPLAISAGRSLVALEPDDRAGAHFLLAKRLHSAHDATAKRHVLLALEETPRYRDARQLLLRIIAEETKPTRTPTKVEP